MKAPTKFERISIWKLIFARASFVEAKLAAERMLADPKLERQIQRALLVQFAVAYARPFLRCSLIKGMNNEPLIEASIVPTEYADLHKEHVGNRNGAIAHTDATKYLGYDLNSVVILVDPDGFSLPTESFVDIARPALERTSNLCKHLIAHCEEQIKNQIKPFARHFENLAPGKYRILFEDLPTGWLEKC